MGEDVAVQRIERRVVHVRLQHALAQVVEDARVREPSLQLTDTYFQLVLGLFGGLPISIFAKVAMGPRLLKLICNLTTLFGF